MSKNTFANEEVMEEYLLALLTEAEDVLPPAAECEKEQEKAPSNKTKLEVDVNEQQAQPKAQLSHRSNLTKQEKPYADETVLKPVENLLRQVTPEPVVEPKKEVITEKKASTIIRDETRTAAQQDGVQPPKLPTTEKPYQQGDFQALFFQVSGLTLAVPLTELGGIHNMTEVSPLFGKPKWYMGLMVHREQKLNVVDSALWVMPEKYDKDLEDSLNYQYLIMLGESNWGLACESLINTVTLSQNDIKWRANQGKRPWLAGLVKEKMCALLDVDNLIFLLEQGLDSQDKN
ncbi:chemotaxis protein CheW [Catenovulum maritimum]|uniref:CheW-like domain-containing protein n=1 Tax=Catenovulum maritimum TaxID=1513271 RepID=A0A0J8JLS7_9ALTE|nr:chemotaxis protein CheW [Catenovulum maritimum]KMT65501.1 hypothetical protein XM47_09125 [Catenovulum maritimum]